jgi:hypothetical protein
MEAPEGEAAVGVGVARDFGTDGGMFKGKVVHVRKNRHRHIYHILYEDGDEEDFDLEEYQFAYELRQGLDGGKISLETTTTENDAAWNSDVEVDAWEPSDEAYRGGTSDDEDPKRKRKSKQTSVVPTKKQRQQGKQTSVVATKGKRKTKLSLFPKLVEVQVGDADQRPTASTFKNMSTMALLTYGRDNNLSRKEGWLWELLLAEGTYVY